MVINLKGTWYPYCEIDAVTVRALLESQSAGRFYNANIKGSSNGGAFDCRTHFIPLY